MAAAQGSRRHDQLLARERRRRLGAGAVGLDCLGPCPFRDKFRYFRLLDFLGIPWILSSETRLINGLRAIFARSFFLTLFPGRFLRRGVSLQLWQGKGQTCSWLSLA